jgi:hypothetical protein
VIRSQGEASQVGEAEKESRGEIPFLHFVELYREERTVEIISGDFAKFRGSSDLAEVQGGYGAKV